MTLSLREEARMRKRFKAATLFFVFFVLVANLCWAAPVETTIAERAVAINLVKADDLSPAPWPDDMAPMPNSV
jgi:hypothetical protein